MTDDEIIARASQLHTKRPELRPLDWHILGAAIDAKVSGLPLAYVRTRPGLYGSLPAFLPAIERLIKAGLVERRSIDYQSTDYAGKKGRAPRAEIHYFRTKTPIVPFSL
jgi:hypothetical protein